VREAKIKDLVFFRVLFKKTPKILKVLIWV